MSLVSEQWYGLQALQLLDGVFAGEKLLAISMFYDTEVNRYLFQEPDVFEVCEFPQVLRTISKNSETIYYEILYNYNIIKICRGSGLKRLRYFEIDYIRNFVDININTNRSDPLVCIEPLFWIPQSVLIPRAIAPMVLWQENETLRLIIKHFGESSYRSKKNLSVVYSGLDHNRQIYHLFTCIPENLHPEMSFPINLD